MFINQTQGLSPDLLADDFFQSENATSPLPAGDVWATMAEMGSQSLIAAMPEHFADKIIEAIFSKIEIFFVRTFLVLLFYALSPLVKIVPNSCATHALVSILLNCPDLNLGPTLENLKTHVSDMSPENKGLAIGNCPELAQAHNAHAVPLGRRKQEKSILPTTGSRYTAETFHFVSYVPINGHLFELDGLKRYPIDHGPWGENEDWTDKFRRVIADRLGLNTGNEHDIRFALMAMVPDRRLAVAKKLQMLKINRSIVIAALKQLVALEERERLPPVESKEDDWVNGNEDGTSAEYLQLEKDVNRVMSNPKLKSDENAPCKRVLKRFSSRTSSFDSTCAPGSPFQNNPLLVSHDYAKSPLVEDSNSSMPSDHAPFPAKDDLVKIDEELDAKEEKQPQDAEKGSNVNDFDPVTCELSEPHQFAPKDLLALLRNIDVEVHNCESFIRDENEKRRKHMVDDCRRIHNYDEFITTFISMLGEQGLLGDLLEHGLNPKKKTVLTNGTENGKPGGGQSGGSLVKKVSSSKLKRAKPKAGRPKRRK
ncbi:ubiquitin carboxyl-terminal hydrolase calypso-like isoform X2 [Tigriopus californicus]|uniref:ubiquitin carboxyl-terminal hydrolase calypso-like isoform X2 n=1 Tax=Tigriopus californicus TaxID=6832 RepID=UPI0027DA513F|nr:ubiquitin carboxyl-terminal hydrolase calypso-like isoform X2 [Tigriopus californicus]